MKLSKLKVIAFIFFLCVSLFHCFIVVRADELEDKEKEIREYEERIKGLQSQQKTLKSTIAYFENKIELTSVSIEQNEEKIEVLEEEIGKLSVKIDRLNESLEITSQLLVVRIIETYKKGSVNPACLFLVSDGFSQFLTRYQYLKVVQAHDRELLFKMEQARFDYDSQKVLKEEKQKEVEEVKLQLEKQRSTLAQQKKDKEYLFTVTKSDEDHYQNLLATARAEYEAIEAAIRRALADLGEGSSIEKGATIALMGNTGGPCCSTGTHLHFEVRKNGEAQNPAGYLKNISVVWDNNPDGEFSFSGDWDWPISDPRITQGYGMTSFARTGFYGGNPHTGLDMVNESHAIKAPKAGTLYKGSTTCGSGCPINFVAIDHGDGLITWYWHVQ